jgi:SAM-dependent methyltransferase
MSSVFLAAARWKRKAEKLARNQISRRRLSSYLKSDRRPWSTGYDEYREQYLKQAIKDPAVLHAFADGGSLPNGYGFRLDARMIEIPWVISRLQERKGLFLDAGSALNYEFVLQAPALAEKKVTIVTLAPEGDAHWRLGVSYVFGDLRKLDFRDELFDSIACISTIEHVGMDNSMYAGKSDIARRTDSRDFLQAIQELKRVLKPGGALFVSFPFGRYENHGWFQQFDAQLVDTLVTGFGPTQARETIFCYDPDGWRISDRASCADREFFDVHESRYFDPNSTVEYPPDYPAGERALACLELVK